MERVDPNLNLTTSEMISICARPSAERGQSCVQLPLRQRFGCMQALGLACGVEPILFNWPAMESPSGSFNSSAAQGLAE